ncbi:hypothetical protein OnM2_080006 [Erysiphe neolycopersici]|uniref:Uncharacterized protein n=1 Tax=Erysiphe neolycopersici TaxID=212602 RepID=A0A420HGA0_9PEZI|nr:hypothetical protein OnM2_080006 [Erysiphe neolycopersici]
MLRVNDIFAEKILDDLDNIDNRLGNSEATTSPILSLNDYKSNYSDDNHRINSHGKDYRICMGEFEPTFEMALDKRPRALLKEIKEPFHPFLKTNDFEFTKHLSRSSSTDLISDTKEEVKGDDQVSKNMYPKIGEDDASRNLNIPEKCWPLLDCSFDSQIKQITEECYPQNSMDYYLREFNGGIDQLARWSLRMKELTNLEPEEFKTALESFRDQTGENPLRTWTVKANTVIGLIRDIQYDMEFELSGLN